MFPLDSAWNRDISGDPVDPHSPDYLVMMKASASRVLWPAYGRAPYGMPVTVVDAGQPKVPVKIAAPMAPGEPTHFPFPQNLAIQVNSDLHAVVLDRSTCTLYETYKTVKDGSGGYTAESGAVFNLSSSALRPDGLVSATASGLPIIPGLVRYDEAAELGEIRHALTFTADATAHAYVHPATISSGTSNATYAPPMGLRIRLRADFDVSKFRAPAARAVLRALQKHGAFLVDNASNLPFWTLSGMQDERWTDADTREIKTLPTDVFEVVQLGQVHQGY